jgi:predicted tellurium resistance membrane protein TerC
MKYLESAVGVVLGFVGVKIVLDFVGMKIPTEASLGIVAGTLAIGAAASLLTAPSGEEVAEDTDR